MEEKITVQNQNLEQEVKEAEQLSTPPTKQFDIVTDKEVLRQISEPLTDPEEIQAISTELIDFIKNGQGALGLAAIQLGKPVRAFIMLTGLDVHPDVTDDQILVAINPEIKKVYGGETLFKEACLSEPGITALVSRHKKIKVKYQTPDGRTVQTTLQNTDACIFEHEFDHLNGKILVDTCIKIFENEGAANEQTENEVHDNNSEDTK